MTHSTPVSSRPAARPSTGPSPQPPWTTFVDLLSHRGRHQPDQVGFIFLRNGEVEEQRLTYGELDRSARQIAATLQAECKQGDRVLLLYQPGLDFIRGFFGCLYAGMIAVPSFPPSTSRNDRSTERLDAIIDSASPVALLTTQRTIEVVEAATPTVTRRISTELIPMGTERRWRAPDLTEDSIACLQYTSGSTSLPKGVMLTHGNLLHNSATIADAFEHTTASVGCNWLPPYHDMGLIGGVLQPVFVGFPDILMSPAAFLQKPLRWLAAISKYRATTCGGPDFAYDMCAKSVRKADLAGLDLSAWDVAFCGAEPIRAATLDAFATAFSSCGFQRQAFYPCYGLAEATLMVTGGAKANPPMLFNAISDDLRSNRLRAATDALELAQPLVGCGVRRSDHDVIIVDPATCQPVKDGVIGEVWVTGGSVARGYWNLPELTNDTFRARLPAGDDREFLRTGDLGCLRDGELFITGRIKDLVIVRGVKHYPHDLEHTVQASHPALEGCPGAAFAIDDDGHERLVITHEVQRSQRKTPPGEILDSIRTAIAERHHVQPHALALLKPGQIRRTSSGKIQRNACRAAFLNGEFETIAVWNAADAATLHHGGAAPESRDASAAPNEMAALELENWLCAQVAGFIGATVEQIDPAEPFARYGLDSASAVSLAGAVSERIGRDLPATLFWDYPTIRSLSAKLVSDPTIGEPSIPPIA